MPAGGVTKNGCIEYPKPAIAADGQHAGSGSSQPKGSQVGSEGASDPGTGKKMAPGEYGNGTLAGKPEVQTPGTTMEEQRARAASRMYPSSKGSRF